LREKQQVDEVVNRIIEEEKRLQEEHLQRKQKNFQYMQEALHDK